MEDTLQPSRATGVGGLVWRFSASLQLGIVLLVLVAAASVVGIVLPQPESFTSSHYIRTRLDPAASDGLKPEEIVALGKAAGVSGSGEDTEAFVRRAQSGQLSEGEYLRLSYVDSYGRAVGRGLMALGFHAVFRSLWFRVLCLLLIVNVVACSSQRLVGQWRLAFGLRAAKEPAWYQKRAASAAVSRSSEIDGSADAVERALRGQGFLVRRRRSTGGATLEATRGWLGALGRLWSPLGLLAGLGRFGATVVHLGVILILLGGFLSGRLSFRHAQPAAPGDVIVVPDTSYRLSARYQLARAWEDVRRLFGLRVERPPTPEERAAQADWCDRTFRPPKVAFRLRMNRFEVGLDTRGKPEYYGAHVTLLDRTPPRDQVIEVNRPLVYRGYYAYQESYVADYRRISSVSLLAEQVRREAAPSEGFHGSQGPAEVLSSVHLAVPPDAEVPVPGTPLTVRILRYFPHWVLPLDADGRPVGEVHNESDEPVNPAIQMRVQAPGLGPRDRWLALPGQPGEARGAIDYGDFRVLAVDFRPGYNTVLAFKTHPVMWPVWIGCGAMMLGVFLCFYCNHERVWALVRLREGGGSEVFLAGNAFKWRERFKARFDAIVAAVREK